MAFGVDSTGFIAKTVTDIIDSINSGYRTVYGAAVNVATSSRIGQRVKLFAGELVEVWELGEAIFNAIDPDAATGTGLDNQLKLNGLARKAATFSEVTLTLTGTPTTVVAAGKRASVPSTAAKFELDSPATITAVGAWATSTGYTVGQRRSANGNVYRVITAGTSAGVGTGPSGTGSDITDGTVHWAFLGVGTGAIDAPATSTVSGPVQGYAGTINTIDTPVSGWSTVTNLLDASVGADIETDATARARRDLSFSKAGMSPLDSIRAEVLAVAGVTSCSIFENFTSATVDGVPSKAFETLVEGGVDQDIIDAIGRTRPGGIEAYGTTSGSWTDAAGVAHTIKFSRPSAVDIWVIVTLNYDARLYPADGDLQVQDSLPTRQNAQPVGKNVVASAIGAGVFADVPGIFDVSSVLIGTSNPPVSSATIAISPRQKAAFDTGRVSVVSSAGSF